MGGRKLRLKFLGLRPTAEGRDNRVRSGEQEEAKGGEPWSVERGEP